MDHHHIKRTILKNIRNEVHKIKEEYSHKGNELLLYNKVKEKVVQTCVTVLLYILK
jgi:hypothetical protein